ncbi:MAG: N-acetylneuraminate synthase family protein [Rectinemataceae bacterium]
MNEAFAIGDRRFDGTGCLVVAEIGTGHGGDVGKARDLIAAAAESGADCAKFQCVIADEILHPAAGTVPLPGGAVPLYERFRALELDEDFYAELKAETEAHGMIFMCTPFGLGSARLLKRIGVRSMKVASPELNHFPLLDELASYGLPTILSSGVSTLADIERAIRRFRSSLALLHCVTAYPAPEEEYNLRLLEGLSRVLGLPVGVSDHSLDPILIPTLAVASGGVIVEKHICLSRDDSGLDDPIAQPPDAFNAMVRAIRRSQSRPPADTIGDLASVYGRARVESALGDGIKRLAPSEEANYLRTNRSIHAVRTIDKGEILGKDDIALLRTEKVLRPGLDPGLLGIVLGRRARREIPAGEGIEWEDVGDIA